MYSIVLNRAKSTIGFWKMGEFERIQEIATEARSAYADGAWRKYVDALEKMIRRKVKEISPRLKFAMRYMSLQSSYGIIEMPHAKVGEHVLFDVVQQDKATAPLWFSPRRSQEEMEAVLEEVLELAERL